MEAKGLLLQVEGGGPEPAQVAQAERAAGAAARKAWAALGALAALLLVLLQLRPQLYLGGARLGAGAAPSDAPDPWASVPHRPAQALNNRPIIGILTIPVSGQRNSSCYGLNATSTFSKIYAEFFASGGARVVPIRFDLPHSEILKLATSINGVYFPPGMTEIREVHSEFMLAAKLLWDFGIAKNEQGVYFPMFGTCMGLQTMSVLAGGPQVLEFHRYHGVTSAIQKLEFTDFARHSRIFSAQAMPPKVVDILESQYVAPNFHYDGISPASFETNAGLRETFRVVTVNHDREGLPFVSTIEGRKAPLYACQWHAEDNFLAFEIEHKHDIIPHHKDAVLAGVSLALFYADELRYNAHAFATPELELQALSYTTTTSYGGSAWAPFSSYCF